MVIVDYCLSFRKSHVKKGHSAVRAYAGSFKDQGIATAATDAAEPGRVLLAGPLRLRMQIVGARQNQDEEENDFHATKVPASPQHDQDKPAQF